MDGMHVLILTCFNYFASHDFAIILFSDHSWVCGYAGQRAFCAGGPQPEDTDDGSWGYGRHWGGKPTGQQPQWNTNLFYKEEVINHFVNKTNKINNNKHVFRQSQVRKPAGSEVKWVECSLIIGTGCQVQVFSLILDNSVSLWAGIQSVGDLVPETSQVRILHSAEEDKLSPFDSSIACLCQSIKISNNKHASIYVCIHTCMHVCVYDGKADNLSPFDSNIARLCQSIEINSNKQVYRQSQARKPTGSGVEWVDCSLIIGAGYWVQYFSFILDSSVILWAGIQSAGDSVPGTLGSNPAFSRKKTTCLLSIRQSLACPRASTLTTTNMYIHLLINGLGLETKSMPTQCRRV